MKFEGITKFISQGAATLASVLKAGLMSKTPFPSSRTEKGKSIVIMGNGPSLRDTIDKDIDWLLMHDLMAVNFAANSEDFLKLMPQYYILADGHFFTGMTQDANVRKLWEKLSMTNWKMTLFVPTKYRHFIKPLLMGATEIEVKYFNLTPVEGFRFLKKLFYDAGLGMPRPRNVMIPAIMCAIRSGYDKIYLCGADHTWTRTLSVDDDNYVITRQPHFYTDNEEEQKRVRETYKDIRLHEVLESMAIAFRSYWEIKEYAAKRRVSIINATPGSMIDAFSRSTPSR